MKSLDGVTVLEADAGLAGSIAGMLLADHGAKVIKLRTTYDSSSRLSIWDRGKAFVSEEESDSLQASADVIISESSMRESGDRVINCVITGYGSCGQLSGRPADDLLVSASAGLCANQPGWNDGPSYIAHPLPSIGAGLLAAQGICAALLLRIETGLHVNVETSLLGGTLSMSTRVLGPSFPSSRNWYWKANGPLPFYSAYACADGKWLQVGCIHDGFVSRAIEALGLEASVMSARPTGPDSLPDTDPAVTQYRLLADAFASRPQEEWLQILEAADVPCAPVQPSSAYLGNAQAIANGLIQEPFPQVGVAVRVSPARSGIQTNSTHPVSCDISPSKPAPLLGVRILEIANLIAGPMSARLLADLGAEVIKLEPIDGGDIARRNGSPAFYPLNCGKRGIAVNLRTEAGREIGQRLAAWADVIIDNMRPGVADRLGLGWEALSRNHPRLIYCHVTAFGSSGPYAHKPGLDPLAGALAGLEIEQGAGSGRPVYLQSAAVDHTAALLAAYGVLMALISRTRTGHGEKVETSLLDAAAFINAPAISTPEQVERPVSQFGLSALVRIYKAADGWLALAARSDEEWQRLRESLKDFATFPEELFASANLRHANDAALADRLEAAFAAKSVAEWLYILDSSAVPAAPVLPGDDATQLGAPPVIANGQVIEHHVGEGGTNQIAHRWLSFDGAKLVPPGPAPKLGEHTEETLTMLGYAPEQIRSWFADGVIAGKASA